MAENIEMLGISEFESYMAAILDAILIIWNRSRLTCPLHTESHIEGHTPHTWTFNRQTIIVNNGVTPLHAGLIVVLCWLWIAYSRTESPCVVLLICLRSSFVRGIHRRTSSHWRGPRHGVHERPDAVGSFLPDVPTSPQHGWNRWHVSASLTVEYAMAPFF